MYYLSLCAEIPAAERFSFCLNTLLSDIAINCPDSRDEIILNQVETFNALANMIKTSREGNALPPAILCRATVPIMLGLARSMGRYAQSQPSLLCRLFPADTMPETSPAAAAASAAAAANNRTPSSRAQDSRHQSAGQFRSIIPRSMSGGLNTIDGTNASTQSPVRSPAGGKKRASLNTFYSVPYDPTTYFFAKYGSSFNQFPNMRFYEVPQRQPDIKFSVQHLQTIFAIAKKLLTKETLEHLDEQASDIFAMRQLKTYGYKSFSETINLVLVTLLRELLQNQHDLPTPFTKDVQEFVKQLFIIGQTELQNKQHDHERETRRAAGEELANTVNKYKVNVMANAACVDLLVWAIADETGEFFEFDSSDSRF